MLISREKNQQKFARNCVKLVKFFIDKFKKNCSIFFSRITCWKKYCGDFRELKSDIGLEFRPKKPKHKFLVVLGLGKAREVILCL